MYVKGDCFGVYGNLNEHVSCVVSESVTLYELPNLLGFKGIVRITGNGSEETKRLMNTFKVCAEDVPQILLSLIFLVFSECDNRATSNTIILSIVFSLANVVSGILSIVIAGKIDK